MDIPFSYFWNILVPKCLNLEPSWHTEIAQVAPKGLSKSSSRPFFHHRFRSALGYPFDRFGLDCSCFSVEFCIILIQFSINFGWPFCTPLKPHALNAPFHKILATTFLCQVLYNFLQIFAQPGGFLTLPPLPAAPLTPPGRALFTPLAAQVSNF